MNLRASALALATLALVGVAVWRSGHAPTARSLDELLGKALGTRPWTSDRGRALLPS